MEVIKRKILGEFFVYTEEEAKNEGIEYRYWKDGIEGEYVITDDKYVCLLRKRKPCERNVYYVLSIGTYWCRTDGRGKDDEVIWEKKRGTQYYNRAMKPFAEWLPAKHFAKDLVRVATRMILNDGKIDWHKLGEMFFKKHSNPPWRARRFFKFTTIQMMMETELDKQLTKYGITDEKIIQDCFLKAITLATQQGDARTLLKAGAELARLKGMYPQKTVVTNEIQVRETRSVDNLIEQEATKIERVRSEREV